MGDADKRRRRAKEKALAARKRRGISPWTWLGRSGEGCEVLVNRNWPSTRMMSLWAFRPAPAGGWAAAAFLLDLDCLGLKDAFVVEDVDRSRVAEILAAEGGASRLELAEAQRWVAGGIRWAREHRFRITGEWEKAVTFLGGVGDVATADVSGLAPGGKMRYTGTMENLEERVLGRTAWEFLEKEGVEYIMEVGADEVLEAEDSAPDEAAEAKRVRDEMIQGVKAMCRATGTAPHPLLEAAVTLVFLVLAGAPESGEDARAGFRDRMEEALEHLPKGSRAEVREAVGQVMQYLMATDPEHREMWADKGTVETLRALDAGIAKLAADVSAWCRETRREPHPMLPQAVAALLLAVEEARDKRGPESGDVLVRGWNKALALAPEKVRPELEAAGEQIVGYFEAKRTKGAGETGGEGAEAERKEGA